MGVTIPKISYVIVNHDACHGQCIIAGIIVRECAVLLMFCSPNYSIFLRCAMLHRLLKIFVSDETKKWPDYELTLEEFLNSLDVEIGYAAIAINREFVPRAEFAQVILQAGDKIECVMPMQGG